MPSPYRAARVRAKMSSSVGQLDGWKGMSNSTSPPTRMTAARMLVVIAPPRAMPRRMPVIGAGARMYSSRLPPSRSQ